MEIPLGVTRIHNFLSLCILQRFIFRQVSETHQAQRGLCAVHQNQYELLVEGKDYTRSQYVAIIL